MKNRNWTAAQKMDVAEEMIHCRDYCGNERETFIDYAEWHGMAALKTVYAEVKNMVEKEWDKSRKEAKAAIKQV